MVQRLFRVALKIHPNWWGQASLSMDGEGDLGEGGHAKAPQRNTGPKIESPFYHKLVTRIGEL